MTANYGLQGAPPFNLSLERALGRRETFLSKKTAVHPTMPAATLLSQRVVRRRSGLDALRAGAQEQRVGCGARRRLARRVESTGDAASIRMLAAETAMALERSELLARLQTSARTDDLTGLPNRRAWEEELPRRWRARGSKHPLCVAMLDLDFFKKYNDERGHQAGDRLLKQSAAAWASELRRATRWRATAAKSSRSSCPAATSLTRGRSSSGFAPRCRAARPSRRASPAGTGASRRRSWSAGPMRPSTRRSGRAGTSSSTAAG